jgi:hypothetical protein
MVEQSSYTCDAFISHSHADTAWVCRELLPRLEKAGLTFELPGDIERTDTKRLAQTKEAIARARYTVAVLSVSYLANEWNTFEHTLAQTLAILESTNRLLPVLVSPLPEGLRPSRLRLLLAVDLTNPKRRERQFRRLIKTLQSPPTAMFGGRAREGHS